MRRIMMIIAMFARLNGESCTDRLLTIPTQPGRWGKFLSSLLMFGWAINLLLGDRSLASWEALAHLVDIFGYVTVGLVFLIAAVAPMVGVATNYLWTSILGTGFALVTWLWLLMEAVMTGSLGRAAVWTCVAGVLASTNAEAQLAMRVYGHDHRASKL